MSPDNNKILPPFLAFSMALTAYCLFTLADTIGKWLQQNDYGVAQILVTINLVGLAISLAAAVYMRGRVDALKSDKWKLHAIRALLMSLGTILVLHALGMLRLAEFYGIIFLSPLWVALISRIFLKQHIPPSRWVAIAVGFLGVLVIAGPELAHMNMGVIAALGASLTGAVAALLARHIGGHEPPTNFAIATHIGMIAMNLPVLVWTGDYTAPELMHWGLFLLYGVLLTTAMISITLVFARSHVVSQVAPLQYTQMVWGVLLGWLVFGNTPQLNVVMGSVLVIGAGLYILKSLRRGRIMNH